MNKFYVYEYVRLDTNEPFYIGKGKGNRWKNTTHRNKYFKNIHKHTNIACIILHENLDEKTANEYECWYIWQLRDIQGYFLVNQTDGGEGISGYKHKEKTKIQHSKRMSGKNNPMYGKKGKDNHNYGSKRSDKYRKEQSERMKGRSHSGEWRKITNEKMKGNKYRSVEVAILKNNEIVKSFDTVNDLYKFVKSNFKKPNSLKTVNNRLKDGKLFHGFILKYKKNM